MKNFKKIVLVLLAVILAVSAALAVNAETKFTDTDGHWAWTAGYIPYLVEKNVLNGYPKSDGTFYFKPDGEVTRAEFIKMLDETFGLTETKAVSYKDVKDTDWFKVYFEKANAQGYILNYGENCDPNGKITREEAISLLVRYLKLDETAKASASTFTDYSTINAKYGDYILEAIYAGLVDGYKQGDGTYQFKPTKTLTRAEALTILYRAAGCIYNKENSYVRDAAAPATNSVVTKSGVTIANQTLTGRTIVTEGAGTGIVTFSNCAIQGDLEIRGDAKVYFDKCTVNNVKVNGNGGVSLLTNTVIDSMELNAQAAISISKSTKVDVLTANSGANGASVIGEGNVNKLNVKCTGLSLSMMPADYEIFNNFTVTIQGKEYNGKSKDGDIYSVEPYASVDKLNYFIEFTAKTDGSLYYYYTTKEAVPNATEFDTGYREAAYSGHFTVKKDTPVAEKTYLINEVQNYPYVVIMLQAGTTRYAPVVVSNSVTTSDGFSVDPTYTASTNSITFKAAHAGVVTWYYTNEGKTLSNNDFQKGYQTAENALKGTITATATSSLTLKLTKAYTDKNEYVAMQLKSSDGTTYVPVVVCVGDSGFTTFPAVKSSGVISYNANVDGNLYYYYSKKADLPASTSFEKAWLEAEYASRLAVTKNVTASFDYRVAYASAYPYLIIAIKTLDGFKAPVSVELGYESGFDILPRVIANGKISYRTDVAGTVMYFFNDTAFSPSSAEFEQYYNIIDASKKGTANAITEYYDGLIEVPSGVKDTAYCYIMLKTKAGNAYEPIVLPVKFNPAEVSITGFLYDPYIKDGKLYVTPVQNGTVRYYYTDIKSDVSPTEFYTNFSKGNNFNGSETVTAGNTTAITINQNARLFNSVIVISFTTGATYSEPVSLFAFEDTEIKTNPTGLSYIAASGLVLVTPNYSGKLYYEFYDKLTDLPSAINKETFTNVEQAVVNKGIALDPAGKKYAVFFLSTELTPQYQYVVVDMETGTAPIAKKYDDGSTVSSTGVFQEINVAATHTWTCKSMNDGYIFFTLVVDEEIADYRGNSTAGNVDYIPATAGGICTYDYTDVYTYAQTLSSNNVKLYAQLFGMSTTGIASLARYKSVVIDLKPATVQ